MRKKEVALLRDLELKVTNFVVAQPGTSGDLAGSAESAAAAAAAAAAGPTTVKDKAYYFALEPDAAILAAWSAETERVYAAFRASMKQSHGVRLPGPVRRGAALSASSRMAEFLMSAEFRALLTRGKGVVEEHRADEVQEVVQLESPKRGAASPQARVAGSVGRRSSAGGVSYMDAHSLTPAETDFLALKVCINVCACVCLFVIACRVVCARW